MEEREVGFEGDLGGILLFGEDTEVVVVGGDLGRGVGKIGGVIDLGCFSGRGLVLVVVE